MGAELGGVTQRVDRRIYLPAREVCAGKLFKAT
jgi:hypothetical protein